MFQLNNLISKKGNSSKHKKGFDLPLVSTAVIGSFYSVVSNLSWQQGFGDNQKRNSYSVYSAVRKSVSLLIFSLTIIFLTSFTLGSGNEQTQNSGLMSISNTPDWTVNFGYSFGSASSPAGDVNGDGYDDVIVGKKENTTNFTNDGKAYVFLGSASGLAVTPVWSDIGANQGSAYGHSLSRAGDVNGDGYDDIIIGEPGYKVGSISRGRALVYYGSSAGPSATPSWTYIGTTTDFGRSVSTAGDLNGDGYDDVIVGIAYGGLDSASNKGAVLVFYGSSAGLSATPDWQKDGTQSYGQFGHRVSTAGDVNNDGYDDIIVGAPVNSGATGQAFVFLGSVSGLSNTPVWTGTGEFSNQIFGYSVYDAGDVNNDGYDDIIVGAPDDNAGGTGKAYVYYGNSSGISASPEWTATGEINSNFGQWAATAGDYNGDGFSDIIVGAPNNSPYGKAYVYKGSSAGPSVNSVWTSEGDATSAAYAITVSTAGDVNNDGYDDVLITPYSPKAFVFHGADGVPPSSNYYVLSDTGISAARNLTGVIITDSSGVNGSAGTKPRCYFKRSTDTNTFIDNTNSTAGWKYVEANGSTSPFDFTINYSLLSGGNGIIANDIVQYFVVAQDLAPVPNVVIDKGTFAAVPTSVNLTSSAFPIGNPLNSYRIHPVIVTGALTGNGSYANLSGAFNAINANSHTGADITVLIMGNTTEPISGAIIGNNGWNTLLIKPDGNEPRTVSAAASPGNPLIRLLGSRNVTIDGLNSNGNSLTISNTQVSGTQATSTIFLDAGASDNTITRCTILGSSQTYSPTIGGTIVLWPYLSSTGNVISYCDIGPAGSVLPNTSIYIQGNVLNSHSNDTIKNCNIYDYYSTFRPSAGVYIGPYTTNIAVKDNKFYQTATRSSANPGTTHSAIRIENNSGNNYLVSGNTIGYSSSNGTGNYTLVGYGGFNFYPIYLSVGNTGTTNVQGNIIQNINYTLQQQSQTFNAIDIASGRVNAGNLSPNLIGSMSSAGNITITGSTGLMDNFGIRCAGTGNKNVSNNLIGGITLSKISDFTQFKFTAIGNLSADTFTCQNNVIGGNIDNSIRTSYNVEGSLDLTGISSISGTSIITNNYVQNLNVNSGGSGGSVMTLTGILLTSNAANNLISQNLIHSSGITGTTSNSNVVNGIRVNSVSGSATVEKNLIHSLTSAAVNNSVNGILASAGSSTFKNNFIRLGINNSGNGLNVGVPFKGISETGGTNKFYFNSVYIGGSPTTGNSNTFGFQSTVINNTRNYYNNIFYNARSNNGSNGKHYSISVGGTSQNPAGLNCNYNILYSIGNGSVLGFFNSTDRPTLASWLSATGKDSNSVFGNPQFINPDGDSSSLDLHIGINPSAVESRGIAIAEVTDDYDGEIRSSLSPTDIGADAGNFVSSDIDAPVILYSLLTDGSSVVSRNFTGVIITDSSGVNVSIGLRPRCYYKRYSDANTFNDNTNSTPGWKYSEATGTSSPFDFNINYSLLNGGSVATGDTIQYFVIAQDLNFNPNLSINSGIFYSIPSGVDLTSAAFPVTGIINSYTLAAINVSGAVTGNGVYTNLTSAFAAINSGSQSGADILISVNGNTTETGATLNSGDWNSLTISPDGGTAKTISGTVNGNALIRLNGADNVTIDGLNSGGNSLTISNTSTSSITGTSTLNLIGDASSNKITNCTILGSSTTLAGSAGGTVTFGTGNSTGNDNNVVSFCNIGPAGTNLPSKAVSFLGSLSASVYNNGDTIRNCNIYDYFSATINSSGINILSGNTDISVLDNKFYQTAARTQTSGMQHFAVSVDFILGNDFKITRNTIGYSASDGAGVYSFAGVANSKFIPVFLNTGAVSPTSVQGNTIAGISMSGSVSGTGTVSPFIGIYCASGLVNIGNDSGNTIGNLSELNSIAFTSSSTSNSEISGIYIISSSGINTSNNVIAGISAANSSTGASSIYLIRSTSTGNWTCENNVIGGTIANSIQSTSASIFTTLNGIYNNGRASTISGNTLRNMTMAAGLNPMAGIVISSGNYTHNVSQNTVYALSNSNTTQSTFVSGIMFSNGSSSSVIERNNIHSLSAFSASSMVYGIYAQTGVATYKNNMIRLGINQAGTGVNTGLSVIGIYETGGTNNFYFNSVYIGGNPVSNNVTTFAFRSIVTTVTRNYINNIFFNARSNSSGAGKHFAISLAGSSPLPAGCTSNYNILYATGNGSVLGFYNNVDRTTLGAWKTATGLDTNSISADPVYKNPTGNSADVNLHIGTFPTPAENAGVLIPSVIDDFEGELRSDLSPTDIGADAGNFINIDINPMTISYTPLVNDSVQSAINFSGVIISDSDGVAVSGNLRPRVYFKKKNDVNVFNDNTSATAGWKYSASNGTASPFDFTMDLTKLNSAPSVNDTIQYFVVAQDMAPTPHIFSNTVTFAEYPASTELTSAAFPVTGAPNFFRLLKAPLNGDYIVGLNLFNRISGKNITFEKSKRIAMKEILVPEGEGINGAVINKITETEDEIFIPVENGKTYEGPLSIKRTDNPELDAQALSGVYANITEAVNDLKTWGSSGPVRFLLNDNSYTSETLPISITPWTGASSVNTLTIKPNDGVTSEISGTNSTAIFDINNGDYFFIDGSNTEGGNTKDLTIRNTSNSALRFINDATNNIIKNSILKSSFMVVLFSTTTGTTGNDNNLIQNNDITGSTLTCGFGIVNTGTGTTSDRKNSGIEIIGNRIYNFTTRGIQDNGNSAGIIYRSNEFFQTSPQSTCIPLHITSNTIEGFIFDKNKIHDMMVSAFGGAYGIWIQNLAAASTGEITNNFILLNSNVQNSGIGIYDQSSVNLNIYHNTIVISGNVTGNQESIGYYRNTGSTVNLKNNIIINTRTGSTATNYVIRNHGNLSLLNSDNNDLLNSGIGNNVFAFDGTAHRNNLNEWKTATGKDSNSISADPIFISSTDLHIDSLQNSPVSNAGTFITGVTHDIDGNLRDTLSPDIGADEFNIPSAAGTLNLTMIMEGFYNSSANSMSMNDTVTVYLRNASSPYAVIDSAKGIIDANTFTGSFTITNAATGNYFIQTRHRNTIETWSGSAVNYISGSTINYDFTYAAAQAFGNNILQIDSSPLRFGIYSGDVNQDGVVDLADGSQIDNDALNFASGYLSTDVNGDNVTDLADAVFADNNGFNFVGKITP